MSAKVLKLDVREDIQRGREPFSKIMQAVARLKPNQNLLLIAPFEPLPLFGVLAQQGFSHRTTPTKDGDWEVLFYRNSGEELPPDAEPEPSQSPRAEGLCKCGCGRQMIEVDARGLEPPQPLVKILEALEGLTPDKELKARTDRRPLHLYAHLDERGYVGRTEEEKDGSFVTFIHPCPAA